MLVDPLILMTVVQKEINGVRAQQSAQGISVFEINDGALLNPTFRTVQAMGGKLNSR